MGNGLILFTSHNSQISTMESNFYVWDADEGHFKSGMKSTITITILFRFIFHKTMLFSNMHNSLICQHSRYEKETKNQGNKVVARVLCLL